MADGLREAKEAGTEELLSVVKKAKENKATEGKKYKELFPDVPYTYSQASSELNKRHYHVQWASDLQEEENSRLREENRLLKSRIMELEKEQSAPADCRILHLQAGEGEDTAYLSLPVTRTVAERWKKMFGRLLVKYPLGTMALNDFMEAVKEKRIRIRM